MTGISAVAALATEVGILGVGLEAEQQSSVTIDSKSSIFKCLCVCVCVIFNSVLLNACREVKRDITNATGCMCVGSACCSMSEWRR